MGIFKNMRNPFCPEYDDCLKMAAQHNLIDFDCFFCPLVNSKKRVSFFDLEGCHLLLWALFRGRMYYEFRQFENLKRLGDT